MEVRERGACGETPSAIGSGSAVSLREITPETLRSILKLSVSDGQRKMVAPIAVSIARAYFEPKLWFRAIYADETPVGFLMMYDDPEKPKYFLWSMMIDARYQRLGFGRRAMICLEEHVRTRPGAKELGLSYYPVDGGPEPFYRNLGYVPCGMDGDEVVAVKSL